MRGVAPLPLPPEVVPAFVRITDIYLQKTSPEPQFKCHQAVIKLLASNNSVVIKLSLVFISCSQAVFNRVLVNLFSMMVTEKATSLTTSSILPLSSCFPKYAEAYQLLHHDKLPPHPEKDHLRSIKHRSSNNNLRSIYLFRI